MNMHYILIDSLVILHVVTHSPGHRRSRVNHHTSQGGDPEPCDGWPDMHTRLRPTLVVTFSRLLLQDTHSCSLSSWFPAHLLSRTTAALDVIDSLTTTISLYSNDPSGDWAIIVCSLVTCDWCLPHASVNVTLNSYYILKLTHWLEV